LNININRKINNTLSSDITLMAFKKMMTGGACQADGQQAGLNQNAFTNLLDNLISGDAMAR
jgi:hypothetical protein